MHSALYFHGFASSPNSAKVNAFRFALQGRVRINAPDLNVPSFAKLSFDAMVDYGVNFGRAEPPDVIVGSSLGAVVALEVIRRGVNAPLVMIAPALGFGDRWRSKLPDGDPIEVFHHALGRNAPIHRAFFERMAQVDVDREPPAVPLTMFIGSNDESVPVDQVAATWRGWRERLVPGSQFVEIGGGDHGLTAHAEVIAHAIERYAAKPEL